MVYCYFYDPTFTVHGVAKAIAGSVTMENDNNEDCYNRCDAVEYISILGDQAWN